jgi:hypothetical protein
VWTAGKHSRSLSQEVDDLDSNSDPSGSKTYIKEEGGLSQGARLGDRDQGRLCQGGACCSGRAASRV